MFWQKFRSNEKCIIAATRIMKDGGRGDKFWQNLCFRHFSSCRVVPCEHHNQQQNDCEWWHKSMTSVRPFWGKTSYCGFLINNFGHLKVLGTVAIHRQSWLKIHWKSFKVIISSRLLFTYKQLHLVVNLSLNNKKLI